jgi:hypothetical protein
MSNVKSFEKEAGLRSWIAENANRSLGDIARRTGGKASEYGKGILEAAKGNNASHMAQAAGEALSAQKKKHLMIGAGAATGLAGLTYLKGRNDMKKHASWYKPTMGEKLQKGFKGNYKKVTEYLKNMPETTKKHVMKKVKVRKGHLYLGGAGIAGAGVGAGLTAARLREKES